MERVIGFEPIASYQVGKHSTFELHPLIVVCNVYVKIRKLELDLYLDQV